MSLITSTLKGLMSAPPSGLSVLMASGIYAGVGYLNTTRSIKAQKERDERQAELQERYRLEDKRFKFARDKDSQRFQLEVEARRMSFQEHQELRRLQFQAKMEQQREQFQDALQNKQMEFSRELANMQAQNARDIQIMSIQANRELAQFQALAMRETQILVARENAQGMLRNQMVVDALKSFPLNISPIVLLNSRPHTLTSLMRFTIGDTPIATKDDTKKDDTKKNDTKKFPIRAEDVIYDVMKYAENPEALNIFIAPVFIDSKVAYQKVLSTKIWEATYQKIESFFTKYYSRDGRTPVVFYPTAWNDKYTSGVHASETLHFFLKDLPCIVLEPKFDGNQFRIAISSWGLGYGSNDHHRSEYIFENDINLSVATAAYNRSINAIETLDLILDSEDISDDDLKHLFTMKHQMRNNVKMFEILKLNELNDSSIDITVKRKRMEQIASIGINKLFTIDDSQDLNSVSEYFSVQIGITLALLADVHHLISTNAFPKLPNLMQNEEILSEVYANKDVRNKLYDTYKSIFAVLRDEEHNMAHTVEERQKIDTNRQSEISEIQRLLKVEGIPEETWEMKVVNYVEQNYGFKSEDFEKVWNKFLYDVKDVHFMRTICDQINEPRKKKQIEFRIDKLYS